MKDGQFFYSFHHMFLNRPRNQYLDNFGLTDLQRPDVMVVGWGVGDWSKGD